VPGPSVRPLESADIDAVLDVTVEAFADLNRRFGEPPEPPGPVAAGRVRMARLLATDPEGAWVAERDGRVVGCSIGLIREGVWGLSLLVVSPDAQSSGVGRELLDRAWEYGRDARGWIILASRDARALRRCPSCVPVRSTTWR
jgi:GNAT superfamily N-acetyltransferase